MNKQFIQGEINTGEEQFINSSIMTQAADIAEKLTELECKLHGIECYVEEMDGKVVVMSYTEEAQDIFDGYYDQYTTELYELLNQQLHAIQA